MIKISNSKFTLQMEKYSLCVHKLKMRMCEFHLSHLFASESSEYTQKHVRISHSLVTYWQCFLVIKLVFFFCSVWNLVALTRSVFISPKITQKRRINLCIFFCCFCCAFAYRTYARRILEYSEKVLNLNVCAIQKKSRVFFSAKVK